jgi:hypothetical protein
MDDAPPRGHPVHGTAGNWLLVTEAVPVHDDTIEQVGDRRKTNMRMWSDTDSFTRRKISRSHVIEKYEGANPLPFFVWQCPANLEISEIRGPGLDNERNGFGLNSAH